MKPSNPVTTVTMIALLAVAALIAGSPAAAGEPSSGLVISAGDLAFLETAHTGIRTPLTPNPPVGLFSAAQIRYLAGPFVASDATPQPTVDAAPGGLMISGSDLRFIMGPGDRGDGLPQEWADGPQRFGFGQ